MQSRNYPTPKNGLFFFWIILFQFFCYYCLKSHLFPGQLLILCLDLWNFQAPIYWTGEFLSFTQGQQNSIFSWLWTYTLWKEHFKPLPPKMEKTGETEALWIQGSINTDNNTTSVSIKHLIFDSNTKLNLPRTCNSPFIS